MHDSGAGLSLQEPSLAAYFQRRLADCARDIDPSPQEDTCWYLSQLLDRFGRADSLFSWEDGSYDLRPLALLYGDALYGQPSAVPTPQPSPAPTPQPRSLTPWPLRFQSRFRLFPNRSAIAISSFRFCWP